jgi:hypothetical protein
MVISTTYWTPLATEGSPEHLCEYVVGVGEPIGIPAAVWSPELVEIFTLLGIAQDLVGLLDLFELLRVTAFVGMVEPGKFVIGLPNVRL